MIQSFRVLNDRGVDREFFINQVNDGVAVKNITGLGPVQATINTSKPLGIPGVLYNSQQIGERNIVFNFDLRGTVGYTASTIRRSLYKTFPIGQLITLTFKVDDEFWVTEGRVETSEPTHFTKDPTHMVSIICVNPYFKKKIDEQPNFIIPSDNSWTTVYYPGETEQGLRFEISVAPGAVPLGLMTSHRIVAETSGYPQESFYFDDFDILGVTGSRFRQDDMISVSSQKRERYARIIKGESSSSPQTYNIIGSLKSGSGGTFIKSEHWPMLRPFKDTKFRFQSEAFDPSDVTVKAFYDIYTEGF